MALLDALREIDARFADAIEAALLDAKAQQLTVLKETLRAPLSAVDEALLRAWEQLWEMALSSGQQREALQEEMRRDAEQRKRDEAAAAKTAAAAAAAVAAAQPCRAPDFRFQPFLSTCPSPEPPISYKGSLCPPLAPSFLLD